MAINSTINKHTLVICANMLVKRGEKYLVIKRSPRKVVAPNIVHTIGGKVDADEDPYVAAERELLEEVGLVAKNIRLRGVVTEVKPNELPNWQIFYFLGDYSEGEVAGNEEGDFLWLTKEEIVRSDLFPSVQRIIDALLDESRGPVFARYLYNEQDELLDGTANSISK